MVERGHERVRRHGGGRGRRGPTVRSLSTSSLCKACGICIELCPSDVFDRDRRWATRWSRARMTAPRACSASCTARTSPSRCSGAEKKAAKGAAATPSDRRARATRRSAAQLADATSGTATGSGAAHHEEALTWPPQPILLQGNEAVAEGAIAAGARFFAGYPITPSTEIAEVLARRLPEVGGTFIQMEDEIASIAAVVRRLAWPARRRSPPPPARASASCRR